MAAHGLVQASIPLAACLAIAQGTKISQQMKDALVKDIYIQRSGPFTNALEVAICCSNVEYVEMLLGLDCE